MLNKFVVSAKAIAGDKHVVRTFYFEVKNLKKEKASQVMLSLHQRSIYISQISHTSIKNKEVLVVKSYSTMHQHQTKSETKIY